MANFAYVRVSTKDQNEERQINALKNFNIDDDFWFVEKVSGRSMENREQLQSMLRAIRKGDTLYITDLSRLGRSTRDLYKIVDIIQNKGADIVSVSGDINTTTPMGRAIFGFFAVMAQFEREIIHERQSEGIAAAKRAGKHIGRPRKVFLQSEFDNFFEQYQKRLVTVTGIAKGLGLSRATVYRLIERKKKELCSSN